MYNVTHDVAVLLERVIAGTVITPSEFNTRINNLAALYGDEAVGESYTLLMSVCEPDTQKRIRRLAESEVLDYEKAHQPNTCDGFCYPCCPLNYLRLPYPCYRNQRSLRLPGYREMDSDAGRHTMEHCRTSQ